MYNHETQAVTLSQKFYLIPYSLFFSSPGGTVVGGMGHGWLVGSNEMPEKQMVLSVLEVP